MGVVKNVENGLGKMLWFLQPRPERCNSPGCVALESEPLTHLIWEQFSLENAKSSYTEVTNTS